jgi:hypothetical protein
VLGDVFGIDGLFVLLVGVVVLAVAVYCAVDVARQPELSPSAKAAWIVGLVAGSFLFVVVGIILEVVYLASVRPKLSRNTALPELLFPRARPRICGSRPSA